MMWEKKKLNDCCLSIADGDHQPPPKAESGVPFVTIANIVDNKFDFSNTMFATESYYDSLDNKRRAQTGDVLYSVVGSFGIPVLITDEQRFVFQRHIAILRCNKKILLPEYLYYTMLTRDFYMMADTVALGAAQRTISLTALRNMEIPIPPLEIQEKIVEKALPYDALIENNKKQIKLLEEAAQRLYKEWFVDMRFLGYENTAIIDESPQKWTPGVLGDVALDNGKNEKKENREEYLYYLPIDCLPKKSLAYTETNEISLAESSLVAFHKDDILFGAMRPYFHKVVIARASGLTRSTCFVINAKNEKYWAFLVMLLFSEDTINYATRISVGTTMPYVRWKDFAQMPISIPSEEIAEKFNELLIPITTKINLLSEEIIRLSQARDLLLPKLMNGEIEI